jgi:hypothetical protein
MNGDLDSRAGCRRRHFRGPTGGAVPTTDMVKLYGAAWSVYVRIVRLALEEKQVKYDRKRSMKDTLPSQG